MAHLAAFLNPKVKEGKELLGQRWCVVLFDFSCASVGDRCFPSRQNFSSHTPGGMVNCPKFFFSKNSSNSVVQKIQPGMPVDNGQPCHHVKDHTLQFGRGNGCASCCRLSAFLSTQTHADVVSKLDSFPSMSQHKKKIKVPSANTPKKSAKNPISHPKHSPL